MADSSKAGRTIGDVVAGLPVPIAIAIGGLVLVVIGSIGPWATLLAISVSGTRGDGRFTIGLAVLAAVLAFVGSRGAVLVAGLTSAAIAGLAGYDLVNIERAVSDDTLFGTHIASAGWGIYLVLVGAAITVIALGVHATDPRRP